DADLAEGRIDLPTLSASVLGNTVQGSIKSSPGNTGRPVLKGELRAEGPDLAAAVIAAAAFQGIDSEDLIALNTALGKRSDKAFLINATLDADLGTDRINVPALTGRLFSNEVRGSLSVLRATGDQPAITGELSADGPDLPALLALAGGLQGADSGLVRLAAALTPATDKAFTFKSKFDADLKEGRTEISTLTAQSLGLNLDGRLKIGHGAIDGHLLVKGTDLKDVLNALGQPDLGSAIQTIDFDAGIKGDGKTVALSPFSVTAQIAALAGGKPVDLRLSAGTAVANLELETLSLKDLSLTGLGINLKAALEATQIKSAPAYAGQITIPTFNLRNVLATLNKPPTLSDPNALSAVGLNAQLEGTSQGVAFRGVVLKLDDTTVNGDLVLKAFAGPDLEFSLVADTLNADRYLAPAENDKVQPITPEVAAAGASMLPLETLRTLKIHGDVQIGQLQISGAKLANLSLTVTGHDGQLALNPV
ncbi:MAG: hypothetical protein ACREXT_04200, partial [Gammaproteobacteria bacterium]